MLGPSVTKILEQNVFRLFSPASAASRGLRKVLPSSNLVFSHHQILFPMSLGAEDMAMVPCPLHWVLYASHSTVQTCLVGLPQLQREQELCPHPWAQSSKGPASPFSRVSLDLEHRPLVHPSLFHRELQVSSSLPCGLAFLLCSHSRMRGSSSVTVDHCLC